jgi:hypothetical protein
VQVLNEEETDRLDPEEMYKMRAIMLSPRRLFDVIDMSIVVILPLKGKAKSLSPWRNQAWGLGRTLPSLLLRFYSSP